jgi:regulator of nucleoside diphosphate kinase
MNCEDLVIEKKEYVLLKRSVNLSNFYKDRTFRDILEKLSHILQNARVCSEDEMPKNVVRLNSIVTIVSNDLGPEIFQLVLPSDITSEDSRISLCTPEGLSMIGRKEGDKIDLSFSSEKISYLIMKVEQQKKNISLDMVL